MNGPPDIELECLCTVEEVERAFDRMAGEIDAHLAGRDALALCVLQGGIIPAGILVPRVEAPLQLDSVHVTRYRNTTRGGDIDWCATPRTPVTGRRVLLVDDILDEGYSLAAIRDWCLAQGAEEVRVAVLVNKLHERKAPGIRADFVGLDLPDRYLVGYGMDFQGWFRNAAGILAVPDQHK
ncbi:MAG: hypoxanthine-guanine phosphoribosyltransferase [Halofilum sp. (in: g-proteobacteria)]